MELRIKKRIVGILLLLGMGLILIPLFFSQPLTADEVQLSDKIPASPKQPASLTVPLPAAEETIPASVSVKPPATEQASLTSASKPVFEQVQSLTDQPAPTISPTMNPSGTAAVTTQSVSRSSNTVPSIRSQQSPAQETSSSATTTPISKSKSATTLVSSKTSAPNNKTKGKVTPPAPSAAQAWVVQMGSFSDKINAQKLMTNLQSKGFAAYIRTVNTAQGERIKVLVGPELRRSDANASLQKMAQEFNLKGMVVKAN